jgi:hypothetical protein
VPYVAFENSKVNTITFSECHVKGFIAAINLMGITHNLEQLFIDFAHSIDEDNFDDSNASIHSSDEEVDPGVSQKLVKELISGDWTNFKKLHYFNLTLGVEVCHNPWVSLKSAKRLAMALPESVREAYITSQDTVNDLSFLLDPVLTEKFHDLGLAFDRLCLPPDVLSTLSLPGQVGVT